jgi:hypothetical protein
MSRSPPPVSLLYLQNGYPYITPLAAFVDQYYVLHPSTMPSFVTRDLRKTLAFVRLEYLFDLPAPTLQPLPREPTPLSPTSPDADNARLQQMAQTTIDSLARYFPALTNGGIVVGLRSVFYRPEQHHLLECLRCARRLQMLSGC